MHLTPGVCDRFHVSSGLQCLGTSPRTPGAYYLAVTYTMASKRIDLAALVAAREQDIKKASPPNLTCLVYAAYQLLGSCG